MLALVKLLALCAGAAGGAACVATGVLPVPDLTPQHTRKPVIERSSSSRLEAQSSEAVQYEAAPEPAPEPEPQPKPQPKEETEGPSEEIAAAPAGAVEYEPPAPAPEPAAAGSGEDPSSGSAAGEFGP
jgi:hypothetical protein